MNNKIRKLEKRKRKVNLEKKKMKRKMNNTEIFIKLFRKSFNDK